MEPFPHYSDHYVVKRNSVDGTYDVFFKATKPNPHLEFRRNFETEDEAKDNIKNIARQDRQDASDIIANFSTWMKQTND